MIKKMLVALSSLILSCFIISGGYGIWQDDLEVDGNIKINNQAQGSINESADINNKSISLKAIQKDEIDINLNYIYLAEGDSVFSYISDGDLSNVDVLEGINQNNNNAKSTDKIDNANKKDNNLISGYSSQNNSDYVYILDENESNKLFDMGETNNQGDYIYVEGNN